MKKFLKKLFSDEEEGDIREIYSLLSRIRLVAGIGILLAVSAMVYFDVAEFDMVPLLLVIIPIFILGNIIWRLVIKYDFYPWMFIRLQFIFIISLITIGMHYTGGFTSDFVLLYSLPILSASFISHRQIIINSIFTFLFFLGLVWYESGYFLSASILPDAHNTEHIIVFFLIIFLVAYIGNFYITKIKAAGKEIQKIKDDYIFRTIHDLRAPANIIRLIMEEYDSPDWLNKHPEASEDVKSVHYANNQIMKLVNDVLAIARGENLGISEITPVDVCAIIRETVKMFSLAILEKRIQVSLGEDLERACLVMGNSQGLREVFINIIDNAIKYNKEGGTISISCLRGGDGMALISVRDTGIGIPKSNLEKIFIPYFRGEVDSSISGTGLGLYIVKKIIESMSGEVRVESEIGSGTEFLVSLPLSK